MRILLTADTIGGVWDYACTLARALDGEGHDVLLAVIGEPGERQHEVPRGVELAARSYRLEWMRDSASDVEACSRWIARLSSLWQADVVHLNQFACALEDFQAPTLVVAHSDVLSWFSETLQAPAPDEWKEYAAWIRVALRRATGVVAPTAYQSRLMQRHYGRAADRVLHNGVAPPSASCAPGEPILVCAARAWDAAKGVSILDEALGLLGAAAPRVHHLGESAAPDGQCLSTRNLIAHGAQPRQEVDRWLARASVYVAPSLYEPFGLAPLEAAFHGCALVLSDIGAFRELWDGCAEFFTPGNSGALAAVLAELPGAPARVASLARAAQQRALRRYTAERMVEEYLAVYADLCSGRPIRPSVRPVRLPA